MEIESKIKRLKIVPKSHPSYYLLHKYWGRKPHNLLQKYISLFTEEGDVVLDPFMGSGGVVIESNKLERTGIGVDLNPMACFIVEETLKDMPNAESLRKEFENVVKGIPEKVIELTYTLDPEGNKQKIDNAIWENGKLTKLKYYSDKKKRVKRADKFDLQQVVTAEKLLKKYKKDGIINYPTDEIMQYVRRNGKTRIDELFSPRNLLIAAFFMAGVNKVGNKSIRESLTLVFTSALPNISSMIPGDAESVTGKSGWQISKFWAPSVHTEKHVIDSLKLRLTKYINGKTELQPLLGSSKYRILNQSCENLKNIKPKSVDYVFTDPPYGDSISYFALSSFWSTWLEHSVDFDGEIIYDPYRGKKENDYSLRLDKAFQQVHRVLKDNKYMSFTFHNRHVKFWKIIIDAVKSAGFELVNVKWVDQAVASGTQGINRKNTLTGDFVYTFKKVNKSVLKDEQNNGEEYILKVISRLIKKEGYVETSKLYESLIPVLVANNAYYDSAGRILNIDGFIKTKYTYKKMENGTHAWTI